MNKLTNCLLKRLLNKCQNKFNSLSKTKALSFRNFPSRARPFCQAASSHNCLAFGRSQTPVFKTVLPDKTIRRNNTDMAQQIKEPFQRLPTNVKPVNYDIKLKPNLKAFTFEGTESISI